MELREIPLVSIYLPEYIAREKIDDKAIIELAESIKAVGLLEPIVVRPIDGDKFELVAGHRRYLAFKYLQRTTIPAIIQSFDASTAEIAKLSENLIRKDLNPLEEALLIDRIIEKFNLSVNEVAEKLGRSREFVVSRIELLNYPEYVKNAVRDKKISLSVARELMMIDDEFKRKMYFEYAIVQGINLKTARAWRQRYEIDKSITPEIVINEKPVEVENKKIYRCEICNELYEINEINYVLMCNHCTEILANALQNAHDEKK